MKICIVGGGTAGWMAALMMSTLKSEHQYTVIESSDIGIIGVGEGTTGLISTIVNSSLYQTNEIEFAKETDGTPKLGIRFKNWTGDGSHFDAALEGSYTSRNTEGLDTAVFSSVLEDLPIEMVADSSAYSYHNKTNFTSDLTTQDRVHAWHTDAHKLGQYLKSKCHGVNHIDAKVESINIVDQKINSLDLHTGQNVEADLFVDCTGFARILSKSLDQELVSFKEYLPLDTALMFRVIGDDAKKVPVTTAHAVNSGWIFEIPTVHRIGRGYICHSGYIDEVGALKELRDLYNKDIEIVKKISFESARLKESFHSNCISFGLSACFFEPLQATNIHCTIVQIVDFVTNCLTSNIETTCSVASQKLHNKRMNKMFDDIADFISLHYEGGREDTPFWKYVKYEKPKREFVWHILDVAKSRLTRTVDFEDYIGAPAQPLYNITLAGLGKFDKETIENQYKSWNLDHHEIVKALQERNRIVNLADVVDTEDFICALSSVG